MKDEFTVAFGIYDSHEHIKIKVYNQFCVLLERSKLCLILTLVSPEALASILLFYLICLINFLSYIF